jgi:hypothetical protein
VRYMKVLENKVSKQIVWTELHQLIFSYAKLSGYMDGREIILTKFFFQDVSLVHSMIPLGRLPIMTLTNLHILLLHF